MRWGLTALRDLLNSSLLLSKKVILTKIGEKKLNDQQSKTYKEFKNMDLLIVKGGGFLHTYKRFTDIYYLYYSYFILFSHINGKKIV